jgi:alpha-ribazole phosphatase
VVRHGQTQRAGFFGSSEVALTDLGRQQLWEAAGDRRWEVIFTSPRRRCAEFAEALADRLGIRSCTDARLAEMHFGDWEGRTAEELMASDAEALTRFWQNPVQHPPPGAESLGQLRARVFSFWSELATYDLDLPLVLTHGGPIRILLAEQRGVTLDRLLEMEVAHAVRHQIPLNVALNGIPPPASDGNGSCGRC